MRCENSERFIKLCVDGEGALWKNSFVEFSLCYSKNRHIYICYRPYSLSTRGATTSDDENKKLKHDVGAIKTITSISNSSLSYRKKLEVILKEAVKWAGTDHAVILNSTKPVISIDASCGYEQQQIRLAGGAINDESTRSNMRRVLWEKRPIEVKDTANDPNNLPIEKTLHSFYGHPLIFHDEVIGALIVEAKEYGGFSKDAKDILTIVADVIAPIIVREKSKDDRWRSELIAAQSLGVALLHKDDLTEAHTRGVVFYTHQIATSLGIRGKELDEYVIGSYTHDVGKIGMKREILRGPIKIPRGSEEWRFIEKHVSDGERMLYYWKKSTPRIFNIAATHHEWYDGTGYPRRLKGTEIPHEGRVVLSADCLEAGSNPNRPYKAPKMMAEIIEEILTDGHHDPMIAAKTKELFEMGALSSTLRNEFSMDEYLRIRDLLPLG